MAWLDRNRHKRLDPRAILEAARAIIVLGVSYHLAKPVAERGRVPRTRDPRPAGSSAPRANPVVDGAPRTARPTSIPFPPTNFKGAGKTTGGGHGVIARYARFRDYHEALAPRLGELAAFVNELGGTETRSLWYVDTGPILERDLAQRAGIGFIGKHTNLISRELGNWFFLAEILTTLDLAEDEPERNRCGACRRCLDACPTQAITGPFQLDARRCVAYLTIELKGAIPRELRPLIGARVFGCDDCLEACPWNRFAQEGRIMPEARRGDLAQADLLGLLAMSEREFKTRFAGTPLFRSKRRGLSRNACVALGNIGDQAALPALRQAAEDPDPLIAEHAAWALAQVQERLNRGSDPDGCR